MKGKIGKDGSLYIVRGTAEKHQACYVSTSNDGSSCSDVCPLFGEPEDVIDETIGGRKYKKGSSITICQNRTLYFSDFVDERIKP